MIYPWQKTQWQQFQQALDQNHMPHAVLFSGIEAIGKMAFADTIAARLLCLQPTTTGQACKQCRSCKVLRSGAHPDFLKLQVAEGSRQILVDQIRRLNQFLSLTRSVSPYRVVILAPAEAMNINAANSILKTLEEPPANTVIVLLTAKPTALLATIRSRCQHYRFPLPTPSQALQWLQAQQPKHEPAMLLKLANGAPLAALQYDDEAVLQQCKRLLTDIVAFIRRQRSIIEVGKAWEALSRKQLLMWQLFWLHTLIRQHYQEETSILNQEVAKPLSEIKARIDLTDLFWLYQQLLQFVREIDAPLNNRLFCEDMLLLWEQAVNK